MSSGDQAAADAILVALANALARNVPVRDEVLREMSPAEREDYWAQVADAKARIKTRNSK